MNYLLDTHSVLWFINGDDQLSQTARSAIEEEDTLKFISITTFWEIAIKVSLGKLKLEMTLNELKQHIVDSGFLVLPITVDDTLLLEKLPFHHRDPFDRMIIAQSITNNLVIITRDSYFPQYPVEILW